jgi:hypothetical protein
MGDTSRLGSVGDGGSQQATRSTVIQLAHGHARGTRLRMAIVMLRVFVVRSSNVPTGLIGMK